MEEELNKKKVLIIDDEVALLEMFKKKFEIENFEVCIEKDGLKGVSRASIFKPDVVLLDIMMPGMDGFETLSAFKKATSLNPLIIIFSNIDQQVKNIQKALDLGADQYLIKSNYTPKEVIDHVKQMLREKEKHFS